MCSAGVVGTVPRIAPVAGSRAMSCSSSEEVSFVVLIGERLSLLQAAFGANPLQAHGELGLLLVGLVVARAGEALRRQLLRGDVAGVRVRVVIGAPLLANRSEIGQRPGAQPCGRRRRAVLADVLGGRRERAPGRVGLRRQRQVDGRLRQRVARLGQPHQLDRLGGRRGQRQGGGVGVADVLGGEDHHPPHDEPRVLAALQHHRQVVQRGVGIRAPRRLDPRGDVVVVAVAALVVEDRPPLQRVLDTLQGHPLLAQLRGGRGGQLERVERRTRVAFAARRQEVERVRLHRHRGARGAAQHRCQLLGGQGLQCIHAQAREQRAVDLERRVLGGGADQRQQALLHRGQQRVLLGLVEAVDLIEEQHRLPAAGVAPVGRPLDHRAHLRAPRLHGAQLLERRARARGHHPRERRLARAGRTVEHHRVRVALLDRRAQGRARAEQVRLADELLDALRAHPHGERACRCAARRPVGTPPVGGPTALLARRILVEEGVHQRSILRVRRSVGRPQGRGCDLGRVLGRSPARRCRTSLHCRQMHLPLGGIQVLKSLRLLVALLLTVTLAGALSACGSSSKSSSSTVTNLMGTAPDYLDPGLGYTTQAAEADWIAYTGLLTYAHANGEAGTKLIPGVAQTLPTISSDGKTYTFTLRKGLIYSNGAPVKASDFAYTIQRSIKLNWGGKSFFTENIAGAEAFDKGTAKSISGIKAEDTTGKITIELLAPYGAFANVLAFPAAALVPTGTAISNLSNNLPPGVGPYA